MNTIYKYPLILQHRQTVKMPLYAKILSVQMQGYQICLWAELDTDDDAGDRTFLIYGTGHEIPEEEEFGRKYIGTIQQERLVWHIFEYDEDL